MECSGLIVFDVDGTLLPGTSCERLFFRHLLRRGEIGPRSWLGLTARAFALSRLGRPFILKANKGYLRGFSAEEAAGTGREFFEKTVARKISGKALARIDRHRRDGDRMLLLSGMPEFLLLNFSEYLGIEEYVGSVMEVNSDRFTGKTLGPFPLAAGKVEALAPVLERDGIPWSSVTAYADHILDRDLLEKVGRPVVVNAHAELRVIAAERGWEKETFD